MGAASKGSVLLFLRDQIKKRGPEVEKAFLRGLSPEERTAYQSALAFSWVPAAVVARLFEKGAVLLFPGDRVSALREYGRTSMRHDMSGIYKVAMRFTSIPFVVEQTARVWCTYNDTGEPGCEHVQGQKLITFHVKNYPDFPDALKHTLAGSIETIVATAGGRHPSVVYMNNGVADHRWVIRWG
jgi:hypothetical protein